MQILYHDDFDGVVSAALLNAFVRQFLDLHEAHSYVPVNYHMREDWLKPRLPLAQQYPGGRTAIVDFQYHPDAFLYFDHHPTSFLTPEYQAHYEQQPKPLSRWSTAHGSCGRLIFDQLKGCWPTMTHYEPLAAAADMIDQAQYPSVAAYFDAKIPAIALNHTYRVLSDGQKSNIIQQLETHSLEHVLETVRTQADAAVLGNQKLLKKYEMLTEARGAVAFTNLWNTGIPFLRYAPYYYLPRAAYAVTIHFPNSKEASISVARNPWNTDNHRDLGAIAKSYGGGGHAYAAVISFVSPTVEVPHQAAIKVATEIINTLNETACK